MTSILPTSSVNESADKIISIILLGDPDVCTPLACFAKATLRCSIFSFKMSISILSCLISSSKRAISSSWALISFRTESIFF